MYLLSQKLQTLKARKDHLPLTANSAEEHNWKVTVLLCYIFVQVALCQ